MKTIITLSSAIALSLAMGTAIANDRTNRMLEEFDVNQDDSISGDEVQFVLAEKFTAADTNSDGLLTLDEMSAAHEQHHQERAAEHFAELDADENGSISLEEFQAGKPPAGRHGGASKPMFSGEETSTTRQQLHQERAAEHFAELDTDANDSLTVEEFQAGKPPVGEHGNRTEQMFSQLDLDEDGMLSSVEMNAPLVEKFERLDSNQDGVISSDELEQQPPFFGNRGGKHHGRR
ncbi:EF hand domain protein [Beggiatoa sp. PS]|nr:EF hand domain protein [Beggiatoa sp. PS]